MTQTVLITEAHLPWGVALSRHFVKQNWKVIACMPEAARPSSVFPETKQVRIIAMDARSIESVQAAAARVQVVTDHIDLLVNSTASEEGMAPAGIAGISSQGIMDAFHANSLGPIRVIETFLPLMAHGLKRIALLSDVQGSLGLGLAGSDMAYDMSKAALHMAFTMMHGDLSREGYTFRLYVPGTEGDTEQSAAAAFEYFTQPREDEERIVMLDETGQEVPL